MLNWFNNVWGTITNTIDIIIDFFNSIFNIIQSIFYFIPSTITNLFIITISLMSIIAIYKLIRKG